MEKQEPYSAGELCPSQCLKLVEVPSLDIFSPFRGFRRGLDLCGEPKRTIVGQHLHWWRRQPHKWPLPPWACKVLLVLMDSAVLKRGAKGTPGSPESFGVQFSRQSLSRWVTEQYYLLFIKYVHLTFLMLPWNPQPRLAGHLDACVFGMWWVLVLGSGPWFPGQLCKSEVVPITLHRRNF